MTNILIKIIIGLISAFIGFAIGRIGDKYGGHLNTPHHWIYGLILIILGIIYIKTNLGIIALGFGIGHFISDLQDFLDLKFWGVDKEHNWKFWDIS